MFGYIVTNQKALPEDRQRRFRALYCGLCRTLRKRHGLAGSATLSYDLTFLAALLNALYEPGEVEGRERCASISAYNSFSAFSKARMLDCSPSFAFTTLVLFCLPSKIGTDTDRPIELFMLFFN